MDAAAVPLMALERRLAFLGFHKARPTLAPGKEWARIDCSCKKAHGCGDHGEKLLEGITLYARTDHPYLTTTLSIFLNEEARRSIEAELEIDSAYGALCAEGAVKVATAAEQGGQLLVVMVAFSCLQFRRRTYYLVVDATDASLYMIPFVPHHIVCIYTSTPVPRFTGGGRDHELVLLARKFLPERPGGLICVCSPATRAANGEGEGSNEFESRSTGVWQVKRRLFPEIPYAFCQQQMFSLRGKLFWADFKLGLVYCEHLRAGDAFAKFDFVSLPKGYLVGGLTESPAKRRTIACIGGTVYFVYIDHGRRHCRSSRPGDGDEMTVKVWTLDMDRGTWSYHRGFPCPWKEVWRQVDFMDAGARDVDVEPQYPVVMPGGALCLYLHHQERRRTRESDYICSFDMHSKRPLWFGPVRDHHQSGSLFILPTSFFVRNYPPPSKRAHKRKLERSAKKQDEEECAKTCKGGTKVREHLISY